MVTAATAKFWARKGYGVDTSGNLIKQSVTQQVAQAKKEVEQLAKASPSTEEIRQVKTGMGTITVSPSHKYGWRTDEQLVEEAKQKALQTGQVQHVTTGSPQGKTQMVYTITPPKQQYPQPSEAQLQQAAARVGHPIQYYNTQTQKSYYVVPQGGHAVVTEKPAPDYTSIYTGLQAGSKPMPIPPQIPYNIATISQHQVVRKTLATPQPPSIISGAAEGITPSEPQRFVRWLPTWVVQKDTGKVTAAIESRPWQMGELPPLRRTTAREDIMIATLTGVGVASVLTAGAASAGAMALGGGAFSIFSAEFAAGSATAWGGAALTKYLESDVFRPKEEKPFASTDIYKGASWARMNPVTEGKPWYWKFAAGSMPQLFKESGRASEKEYLKVRGVPEADVQKYLDRIEYDTKMEGVIEASGLILQSGFTEMFAQNVLAYSVAKAGGGAMKKVGWDAAGYIAKTLFKPLTIGGFAEGGTQNLMQSQLRGGLTFSLWGTKKEYPLEPLTNTYMYSTISPTGQPITQMMTTTTERKYSQQYQGIIPTVAWGGTIGAVTAYGLGIIPPMVSIAARKPFAGALIQLGEYLSDYSEFGGDVLSKYIYKPSLSAIEGKPSWSLGTRSAGKNIFFGLMEDVNVKKAPVNTFTDIFEAETPVQTGKTTTEVSTNVNLPTTITTNVPVITTTVPTIITVPSETVTTVTTPTNVPVIITTPISTTITTPTTTFTNTFTEVLTQTNVFTPQPKLIPPIPFLPPIGWGGGVGSGVGVGKGKKYVSELDLLLGKGLRQAPINVGAFGFMGHGITVLGLPSVAKAAKAAVPKGAKHEKKGKAHKDGKTSLLPKMNAGYAGGMRLW